MDEQKKDNLNALIDLQNFLGERPNIVGIDDSLDDNHESIKYLFDKYGNKDLKFYSANTHQVSLDELFLIAQEYKKQEADLRKVILKELGQKGLN